MHALRKRCKELRYLLEVFRPVCDKTAHRRLVKELKSLQDTLGDFQDGEVQRLQSQFINGVKHLPVAFTPSARIGS